MSETAAREAYLSRFETSRAELPGAGLPWLAGLRSDALACFVAAGFPTRRDEDWRWTDVSELTSARLGRGAPRVSASGAGAGVRIEPLDEALARDPEAVREHLGRGVDPKLSGFAALNTALFEQGLRVEIEPGAAPEAPIEVAIENRGGTDADEGGVASFTRLLVVVGAGGRATLVERYAGRGDYLESAVTEVVLGPGAELRHVRLQSESQTAWHVASLDVRQERDSRYASHSIALGGRLARVEISVTLADEGADCALDGLYLGRESQLLDHQTLVDHAAPHTTSRELYKGILDGRARGVVRGRVHVRPDAQKIDASQTNRSLLLSDQAIANTKPQLEIYADDVKCSHGASVGRLSDDALFYLRSRGVSLAQARALLSFAFASEVVRSLPAGPIHAEIEQLALDWLPIEAAR